MKSTRLTTVAAAAAALTLALSGCSAGSTADCIMR